jgi:nitroreductase
LSKIFFKDMTKLHLLLLGIISLMASFSINAEVLPEPQTTGGKPLMQVMNERKSSRDYQENQTVTKQDLSNMLWAAWGITHDGKRTIATAMNRQELVLYVVTPTEVSRYNPEANTLTVVNTGDFRKYSTMQDFAAIAPINIVLVVDTSKQSKPEFQGYTAGAASQNIYLYCAQAGLKSVVRAGFDAENLPQVLKLSSDERIMFVQTVGK